ncbi:hypothetical protein EOM82_06410 [bacterium]|nr:hypothetical protein [bacterium]
MNWTEEKITMLLTNYRENKREQKILGYNNEKTAFLEHCLKHLDEYERDLLEKTMLEGVSIRKYSKISGFSRNFIAKQQHLLISQLTKIFNIKFSFDQPQQVT